MAENTESQTAVASQEIASASNGSVTGDLRLHEFTSRIFRNTRFLRVWLPPGYDDPGNSRKYPDFLLREVVPFIAQRYRTAKGPEQTGLGGSSLGASISLYTAMAVPGVFGRLLLESPSLFVSNRQLLRDSRRFSQWPERVF